MRRRPSSRRAAAFPLAGLLIAFAAIALLSDAGCKRALACPDFDSCTDGSVCVEVRCICDTQVVQISPTCRSDGTCDTTLDCPTICTSVKATCPKPITSCGVFVPTECMCDSGSVHDAAVWDCMAGMSVTVSEADCSRACDGGLLKNQGGAGGGGVGGGTSLSTTSGFGGNSLTGGG